MRDAAITIRVQIEDFDAKIESDLIAVISKDIGAIVSFTGLCRDEGGELSVLELEHYPGMAEDEIRRIAQDASVKWKLHAMTVIHRYGKVLPGENIVLVLAAASHRQAAFDGANYLMDFLKTQAPFWKKEHLQNGECEKWVSAKDKDDEALKKWQ